MSKGDIKQKEHKTSLQTIEEDIKDKSLKAK